MSDRRFPILKEGELRSIPWDMIEPHGKQAIYNHSQTLERLAERGGLGACEAMMVLHGKGLREIFEGRHNTHKRQDLCTCRADLAAMAERWARGARWSGGDE